MLSSLSSPSPQKQHIVVPGQLREKPPRLLGIRCGLNPIVRDGEIFWIPVDGLATTADARAAHEDNIGQARNQVNICSTCLLRDRSRLDKSNNKGGTTDQRRRLVASGLLRWLVRTCGMRSNNTSKSRSTLRWSK